MTGFWLVVVTMGLGFAFVTGETFDDPGGWAAVGYVLTWAVPLAALLLVVTRWPAWAARWCWVAVLVPIGFAAWGLVDIDAYRSFQDDVGPVGAVLVMVIGTALAFLGRHAEHTLTAGVAMLAATLVPPALLALSSGEMMRSAMIVAVPVLVAGLLYLFAGLQAHRGHHVGRHAVA
ncbi:MAG TPA: hypothetical protein PLP61_03410 [Nocardioides sp.]|uniref:hypothetical protein n=1 Tax=Nocardioides sp. TaxID=35761 RepID=UPI002BF13943|nr:hypothetical protein [Nocardioides sp.]HQR26067.1 hypothetical protein [Nocardioides sp.]